MQLKTLKSLISLFCILAVYGCSTAENDDFSEIDAEILEIHDDVMPKLEDINHYSEEIRSKIAKLDSLQQEGVSSNTFAEQRLRAADILTRLHVADSLMWEWMRGYEADSAKALADAAATTRYFENEKSKILDIKEKTENGIREAQTFLEN